MACSLKNPPRSSTRERPVRATATRSPTLYWVTSGLISDISPEASNPTNN